MSKLERTLSNVFLALLFSAGSAFASPESAILARPTGDLDLRVDIGSYRDDVGGYEEVVISFPADRVKFEPRGDSLEARFKPELTVWDDTGKEVKSLKGVRQVRMPKGLRLDGRLIDDVTGFRLPPGTYTAEVKVGGGKASGRCKFAFDIPDFKPGRLSLSDIFLARKVAPRDPGPEPDRFLKGGHVLLPAADRRVKTNDPVRFYVELFEIGQLAHTVSFQILDRFGHAVVEDKREYPTYRDKGRFVEGLPLRDLPPGTYTLRVEARAGDQTAAVERAFEKTGTATQLPASFDERAQSLAGDLLRQFSSAQAADRYAKLAPPDRAAFLFGHWMERNQPFARAYVGPLTGIAHHTLDPAILIGLGRTRNLKKKVDKTYADRLAMPDSPLAGEGRQMLKVLLDTNDEDPYALTADALLALEMGNLAEGEVYSAKASRIKPDLADAHNAHAIAKIGRVDFKDAMAGFQRSAELSSGWGGPKVNERFAAVLWGKGDEDDLLDALRQSLSQDPSNPHYYYLVGRILERKDDLEESALAYERQAAVSPLDGRARFDLARVLFKQGEIDSATAIWRELMEARPDYRSVCAHPLLEAYMNIGETGKAQAVIAEELRTLHEEVRAKFEDISLVGGPDELSEYRDLEAEDQQGFVRSFWQKRDPTPATPGNERLVEHYRRVLYALQNYGIDETKWDTRGDVYIRYGEPAHISKRGDIRFEMTREVVRVRNRLMNTLTSEAREEIIARNGRYRTSIRDEVIEGEYGQQVRNSDFESIDFEMNPNRAFFLTEYDEDPRYVRGTEEATYRRTYREKPIQGIPLFPIDGTTPWEYWTYPNVAGGIEVVFTAQDEKGGYFFPEITMGRKISEHNHLLWNERRPEIVVDRAKRVTPDIYAPPGNAIEFYYASADFRSSEDRSRLEVYVGVPVTEMGDRDQDVFERGVALFDSTWTPIYRGMEPVGFVADGDLVEEGTLAIDELALRVPPGRYYLGVQVNHPESRRQGGYTQELIVESYTGDGLMISDIELAGSVIQDPEVSSKGGHRVLSLPSRTYKRGQPVVIYYEVYGLSTDEFGRTKYRVDYRIDPKRGKLSGIRILRALGRLIGIEEKSVVTISYERSGSEVDEHNFLEIDPGDTKEGRYEITITVTDLNSEATTEKSVIFLIGE